MFNTAVNVIMHYRGLEGASLEQWKCERWNG